MRIIQGKLSPLKMGRCYGCFSCLFFGFLFFRANLKEVRSMKIVSLGFASGEMARGGGGDGRKRNLNSILGNAKTLSKVSDGAPTPAILPPNSIQQIAPLGIIFRAGATQRRRNKINNVNTRIRFRNMKESFQAHEK